MEIRDLRDFIKVLDKAGQLVKVKQEVDWNLEVGAITRRACELQERATLFEKVKGADGVRILGCPCATYARTALAMGMEANTSVKEIGREFEKRISKPIDPSRVKSGPCKENIIKGKDINLFNFGAPMIHDGDGGRYIGSWHLIVTRDLDSDWVNWGTYRQMIHNENTMGGTVSDHQHIGQIYKKYEKANKPMPFATAIGTEPLCVLVSALPIPAGVNEADVAGGLRKKPVDLVKCETVDLEVPAHAEIVIEGHVPPGVRIEEGPFGEFTGFSSAPRAPRPIFEVSCIAHRNKPILTMSNMGMPVDDSSIIMTIGVRSAVMKALAGLPVVEAAMLPYSSIFLAVVSVERAYSGIAQNIADAIWGSKLGSQTPFVVVVDADVDVFDLKEVIHAIVMRCHPVRGVHPRSNCPGHGLMPFLNSRERLWAEGAHLLLDCTWPMDWHPHTEIPPVISFGTSYPKKLQNKVLDNWGKYGF